MGHFCLSVNGSTALNQQSELGLWRQQWLLNDWATVLSKSARGGENISVLICEIGLCTHQFFKLPLPVAQLLVHAQTDLGALQGGDDL